RKPPTSAPVVAPIAAPFPASPPIAPPTAPTAAPRAAPLATCPVGPDGGGAIAAGFAPDCWVAQTWHSPWSFCCWAALCPRAGSTYPWAHAGPAATAARVRTPATTPITCFATRCIDPSLVSRPFDGSDPGGRGAARPWNPRAAGSDSGLASIAHLR